MRRRNIIFSVILAVIMAVVVALILIIGVEVILNQSNYTVSAQIPLSTRVFQTPAPTNLPFIVSPTLSPIPTIIPTVLPTALTDSYTVAPGDSFFGIAQKLGIDWQTLALVNGTDDPNFVIYPGQTITVPNTTKVPSPTILSGKQIIVVIGQQKAYAFEDGLLVNTFAVSTGTVYHPTVLGNFEIKVKYTSTEMTDGKTYDLKNVPWTMYFGNDEVSWHEGYSLHGTYWHHNFGHPMSHGCVNMKTPDAKWVFDWAAVGTPVSIIN